MFESSNPTGTIQRQVISTIKEFEGLRRCWDNFQVDLMNSHSWNLLWWKAFQNRGSLRLLVFRKEEEVVGIAPFYKDRWFGLGRLRFIASGATCTDYVDLISDSEHYEACGASLAEYIREQKFAVVELECPNEERLSDYLKSALSTGYDFDHRDVEPTWLLDLPSEWGEFLAARRSSLRRKINKAIRRLDSGELAIALLSESLPVDAAIDVFKDLHTRRMNSIGKPGVFADPQFEEFVTSLVKKKAATGGVEIIVASQDGSPVGVQVYFDTPNGYQLYQSGYAPDAMKLEPGHLLFTEMIKRAIRRGDTKFDFLRGNEPYKEFWEATPHGQKKLRMIRSRFLPRMIAKVVETSRRMVRGA